MVTTWKKVRFIMVDIIDNRVARIKQVINSKHLLTKKQTLAYIKAIINRKI